MYELALIERPGDVWDYVMVTPEVVPEELGRRIDAARAVTKIPYVREHPWPEGRLPIAAFDDLFQPAWTYDPTPLDEVWRGRCLDGYARELFAVAQAARASLNLDDPLIACVLRRISARSHALDDLSRGEALKRLRDGFHAPRADRHGAGFYDELARLLPDPELVSVACRGEGDWPMLRLLCAEQRRRADATDHRPIHSLFISMSADVHPAVSWWGGEDMWFSEGLAHGDLLIEDRPNGAPIKELIERYRRRPQVVLADAAQTDKAAWESTFAGDPIDLRGLQTRERVLKARELLRRHAAGEPYASLAGKRWESDRTIVVVPIGWGYRLILRDDAGVLHPHSALTHEAYNNLKPSAIGGAARGRDA